MTLDLNTTRKGVMKMARKQIRAPLDDNSLNNINHNFEELYKNYDEVVENVSEKAFSKVVDSAKLNWKEPVATFNDLPTNAEVGETRMVRDTGKVYRYSPPWVEIQEIDAGPVNEVDSRLSAQLAQKVDEVILKGSTVNFYADSHLIHSISLEEAGNSSLVQSYIDSLVSSGQIQGATLGDKSVTVDNLAFTTKKDILPNYRVIKKYIINYDGSLVWHAGYITTELIAVDIGREVEVKNCRRLAFYNSDGTLNKYFELGEGENITTHKATAPFMRVSYSNASGWQANLYLNYIDSSYIAEKTVIPVEPNLFKIEDFTPNRAIDINTGDLIENSNNGVTGFIPYDNGYEYTVTSGVTENLIGLYDIDKKYIGMLKGNLKDEPFTFNANNPNVKYFRVVIRNTFDKSKYEIRRGRKLHKDLVGDSYELPGLQITRHNLERNMGYLLEEKEKHVMSGKTMYLFGDSITYWDQRYATWVDPTYFIVGYPTHIREKLGVNTINTAQSGATISTIKADNNIHSKVMEADVSNADYAIITGGNNDHGSKVPIGTLGTRDDDPSTFDTLTFIGSLRSMVHDLYTKNPYIKLYFLTPFNNTKSGVFTQYCDAMEQVGDMYGIPTLRMDKKSRFNVLNTDLLTLDGSHPNNEGYEMLASIIIPFLENHA